MEIQRKRKDKIIYRTGWGQVTIYSHYLFYTDAATNRITRQHLQRREVLTNGATPGQRRAVLAWIESGFMGRCP